ncbi:MAG TPA: FHA domain-containing protein [Gemmatimonadaceae bacterium]|nr:FHA domain-containing protein [Gemmatimonadaceae bacterium]
MNWLEYKDTLRELGPEELVVGSGSQASWRVLQADLMPRHFVVSTTGGTSAVRPFSPESVLVVNGKQVTGATEVHDGDVIEAGSGQFAFWAESPKKRAEAPVTVPTGHLIDSAARIAYPLGLSTGLGRDPSNAIVLSSPTVSRFHAELRREAGGFALHGMGTAGAKLNGQPLTAPRLLEEGDEIQVDGSTYKFTRAPLPAGVRPAASVEELELDPDATRRPTVRMDGIPGQSLEPAERGASPVMIVMAAMLVVIALLAVFFLMRI